MGNDNIKNTFFNRADRAKQFAPFDALRGLREELAKIVKEELLVQWQQEKSALESMSVPAAAGTLHKLKLKTCDANISYAENYALWLHTIYGKLKKI